jgi:hypothetical protein
VLCEERRQDEKKHAQGEGEGAAGARLLHSDNPPDMHSQHATLLQLQLANLLHDVVGK